MSSVCPHQVAPVAYTGLSTLTQLHTVHFHAPHWTVGPDRSTWHRASTRKLAPTTFTDRLDRPCHRYHVRPRNHRPRVWPRLMTQLLAMKDWLQFVAVTVFFGCLAAAYFFAQRGQRKPRVLPPPRSKGTDRSYQETNSVAKLFLEAVSLKEGDASWPVVLKHLNTENEPRIRTLLLELRWLNPSNPREALEVIETICMESKHESETLTRADLLERAQSRLKVARA